MAVRGLGQTTARNAAANVVRGGAMAAVAIVLPRFLTHSLDTDHFAAWSLVLQISAYASYLDFGLQTAIARFVAQALELENRERRAKLVATALALLSAVGVLAFLLISVAVWQIPHVFRGVPAGMLGEFRRAALLLAVSACALLPLSTYTGVLLGMGRNEIPALAIGGSRMAGAAAVIVAVHFTQSLPVLASCFGLANLLGGLVQMGVVHRMADGGRVRRQYVSRAVGGELLRFCASLTVWSVGMLLISGLDVTIVGHFQFAGVGPYALASLLITFFAGLTSAVLSALLPPVAALYARGETRRIQRIVLTATRLILLVNLCVTAAVFLFGGTALRLWVGEAYASQALPILKVLVLAQTLRLIGGPYSILLIGAGEQSRAIPGTIFEALVNLTVSVAGMIYFGPIGVAWGTLAGAMCALLWILLRTMPSSAGAIPVRLAQFLREAAIPAGLPLLPLLALWMVHGFLAAPVYAGALAVCAGATVVLSVRTVRRASVLFGANA